MRNLFVVILLLWLLPAQVQVQAQEWEDQQLFEGATATQTLRILSSTDTSFFAPLIKGFLADHPGWDIEYLVTETARINGVFQENTEAFDIVISSAMDLQLKLVNDGFALALPGIDHPDWAQWRNSLFAFTSEPATIVVNRAAFSDKDMPRTRQELIRALRSDPGLFRDRLGTYDLRRSGVGYLFATQDARVSETYWRLMEVMGSLKVRLYCCSGEMIDDVASGKLLVAYNVLGSYAEVRQQSDDRFEIILPSDFPTTMMRTGLVSKDSTHPDAAAAFIRHMIKAQALMPGRGSFAMPPLNLTPEGSNPTVIALEPALMTYLDKLKKRTFLKEWVSAVIQ